MNPEFCVEISSKMVLSSLDLDQHFPDRFVGSITSSKSYWAQHIQHNIFNRLDYCCWTLLNSRVNPSSDCLSKALRSISVTCPLPLLLFLPALCLLMSRVSTILSTFHHFSYLGKITNSCRGKQKHYSSPVLVVQSCLHCPRRLHIHCQTDVKAILTDYWSKPRWCHYNFAT